MRPKLQKQQSVKPIIALQKTFQPTQAEASASSPKAMTEVDAMLKMIRKQLPAGRNRSQ